MDLKLSDELKEIQNLAKDAAEKLLKPIRAKLDEEEKYPLEFVKELGRLGLLSIFVPEEYGGLGLGVTALSLVTEEISKVCLGASTAYAANALGAMPIILSGTEEQKKKYLPKIASGECLAAFGLTEAEAGSDAMAMKAKTVKEGDCYVLNGSKQFITNAGQADVYTVFAVTNPARGARGISGFILEKGMPGFDFSKKEIKMGIRCSETRSLNFANCKVPAENLLGGKEGWGAIMVLNTLNRSRIGVGAQGVGLAQGAFNEAMAYAKQRRQFGQSIASFQAIQHKFADMGMLIESARALVYKAAWYADSGADKDTVAKFGAMAKCFASDAAMKVTVEAVQICGGIGYMRDFPVEKYMRDAKVTQIYEGTNQIQRNEIAMMMIKEAASKSRKALAAA